ncbi:MAG: zinc-ribbon domain-containing protein [Chloroflexi bacterium]|nr:zinc-ribbon domain-containing protein [Chloroflexota bacterium]
MSIEHERKRCPKCGHSNRAAAKVCTECGYAFFLEDTSGMLRKRCSHCGFMNKMGAKVCSQCGSKFHGKLLSSKARSHNLTQKWCPQCGAQRREGAKVCSYCGYRFKEIKIEPPVVQSSALAAPAIEHSPAPTEQPVVQSNTLADPVTIQNVASVPPEPKVPDLSGEPAPYITQEELERLRQMGGERPGVFLRLYKAIRDDKP